MADHRAVRATCEAVRRLLQQSWSPALFGGVQLDFAVLAPEQFDPGLTSGLSVLLFRISVDHSYRQPSRDSGARTPLPLQLGLLLTAWGTSSRTEQDVLTWAMRVLADNPVLPSGVLDTAEAGVFGSDETVEVLPADLTNEEMFRLWEVLPGDIHLSVPYLARVLRIDSTAVGAGGGPVLERRFEYTEVPAATSRAGAPA